MEVPIIFKNTKVNNPDRKKITIISQTANEIIADINYAEQVEEQGTAITAELFDDFQNILLQGEKNAAEALSKANQSIEDVEILRTDIAEKQGTKIYLDGQLLSSVDSESKVDVSQGSTNANKVLVTDSIGQVGPSNTIPLGNGIFLSSAKDAITGEVGVVIVFPEQN